jgi:cytochrome b6-f complex iron-sulfur subunit
MKRREFVILVGVGGSLPLVVASCAPKVAKQENNNANESDDGFQEVGKLADLDKNGQLLNAKLAGDKKALIIRDPANKAQLIAVNPTCTHAGCTVAWQSEQKEFVCPCHDSRYTIDGKVLQGPAEKPLATYAVKLERDSILVRVI